MQRLLHLCLSLWLSVRLVSADTYCNPNVMGRPRTGDCLAVFNSMPFSVKSPHAALSASRAFVEPQFLSAPFSPVVNPHPDTQMVQLPRIWRRKTCHIALMSLPDWGGVVRRPIVSSSWGIVQREALAAINNCVRWSRASGAIQFVKSSDGTDGLMIYIYEGRYTRFTQILNIYMSGSTAINPYKLISMAGTGNTTDLPA